MALGFRRAIDNAISRARFAEPVPRDHLGHQPEPQGGLGCDALLIAHERPTQDIAERDAAMEHPHRLE